MIIAGVGYLAMPLAIIGSQFGETWKQRRILLTVEKMKYAMGGNVDIDQLREVFHECSDGTEEISFDQFMMITESLDMGFASGVWGINCNLTCSLFAVLGFRFPYASPLARGRSGVEVKTSTSIIVVARSDRR